MSYLFTRHNEDPVDEFHLTGLWILNALRCTEDGLYIVTITKRRNVFSIYIYIHKKLVFRYRQSVTSERTEEQLMCRYPGP